MENLKSLLGTLKVGGEITFLHTSVIGLGEPELFVIKKYNEGTQDKDFLDKGAIDGGFSVFRFDNTGSSMNTKSVSRGYLNLYTFDMFDNLITSRIIVRDMTLVSVEVEA